MPDPQPSEPLQVGAEPIVEILEFGDGGDGVARAGTTPIYVHGAIPGEQVRVRISAVQPTHLRAEPIERLTSAADRRTPRCEVFGTCAACRFQHVSASRRAQFETDRVRAALQRALGEAAPIPTPWQARDDAYGDRCRLVLRASRRGRVIAFGLPDRTGTGIVDVGDCPATAPRAVAVAQAIAAEATARELTALRAIVTHSASNGLAVHATLVAGTARLPHAQRLADVATAAGATGISLNQHEGREDRLFGRRTTALRGRTFLTETVGELALRLSATTFFEATHTGAAAMADAVRRAAAVANGDVVVDLYSGSGLFSLVLARDGARVVGVENNRQAVHDAEGSAHDAGLTAVRFVAERVETMLVDLERERPDVVVVDPPPGGMAEPEIARVARLLAPARIVCVARDPGSAAREVARFCGFGYRVADVTLVDNDPLARGIGVVSRLERPA